MDVRVGPQRRLSAKELMLSNYGVGEDSWRVPWTSRRSNQSIIQVISPEYSLEGLMLKLQYFGHLMRRANLLEKTLMLGKIDGRKRRGGQRMKWLNGIIDSKDVSLSKLWGDSEGQGSLTCCSSWVKKTRVSNWTRARVTWRNFKISAAIIHSSQDMEMTSEPINR